jgi:K(+)-stimulated pyrophosphate-energized sodium pump
MNILIKLTCLVGLVIAPILGGHSTETALAEVEEEITVEMTKENADMATATVQYSTLKEGEKVSETITFEGTESEVHKQLEAFETGIAKSSGAVEKVIEKVDIKKN